MPKFLITLVLEKKNLDIDAVKERTKKVLEREFSDERNKAKVTEIQVGKMIYG